MQLAFIALFSLQIIGTLTAPFYLRIRGKMSDHKMKFSKRHILKDITLHFLMMSFITAHFVVILYSLLNTQAKAPQQLLFFASLEVVFLAAALYGSGMYIAAILFEAVTRRRFSIIRLLHGPISHSIMYGAYLASFGNLANIARFSEGNISLSPIVFFVVGALGGYSAGISAISSGISYIYTILAVVIGLAFSLNQDLLNPFSAHFEGYFVMSTIIGVVFFFWSKSHNAKFSWYRPINVTKIRLF